MDMEPIFISVYAVVVYGVGWYIGYRIGYQKREKQFQNEPIIWSVNGEQAVRLTHGNDCVNVTIKNKDLVKFEIYEVKKVI